MQAVHANDFVASKVVQSDPYFFVHNIEPFPDISSLILKVPRYFMLNCVRIYCGVSFGKIILDKGYRAYFQVYMKHQVGLFKAIHWRNKKYHLPLKQNITWSAHRITPLISKIPVNDWSALSIGYKYCMKLFGPISNGVYG